MSVLAEAGLDVSGVTVVDGSGLAVEDQVTCTIVADVLAHEPTEDLIAASLPIAGESGTLVERFTDPDTVGRVRAKTGTLNTVTGLAGVAHTRIEDDARFALVANVAPSERIPIEAVVAQETLVELLVSHPVLPDVSGLGPR